MKSMFDREYIWGLVKIGERLGISHVEAHRRIMAGDFPAERAGFQWAARASDLDAYVVVKPGDLRRRENRRLSARA